MIIKITRLRPRQELQGMFGGAVSMPQFECCFFFVIWAFVLSQNSGIQPRRKEQEKWVYKHRRGFGVEIVVLIDTNALAITAFPIRSYACHKFFNYNPSMLFSSLCLFSGSPFFYSLFCFYISFRRHHSVSGLCVYDDPLNIVSPSTSIE